MTQGNLIILTSKDLKEDKKEIRPTNLIAYDFNISGTVIEKADFIIYNYDNNSIFLKNRFNTRNN